MQPSSAPLPPLLVPLLLPPPPGLQAGPLWVPWSSQAVLKQDYPYYLFVSRLSFFFPVIPYFVSPRRPGVLRRLFALLVFFPLNGMKNFQFCPLSAEIPNSSYSFFSRLQFFFLRLLGFRNFDDIEFPLS